MAIQDDCILWNKQGSLAQITNSEIGPDFAWSGTSTYNAGKFDNGSYSAVAGNWMKTATDTGFVANAFIVEAWVKTDYNVVNGNPSDHANHELFEWWKSGNDKIILMFDAGANALQMANKVSGGWNQFNATNAAISWSAGDLVHLMFVMDRGGIGGGANTRRIYVNGSLAQASNVAVNNQANSGGYYKMLSLDGAAWDWNGLSDNVKVYNVVSESHITDIAANKDTEGWPVTDGGKLLDGFNSQLVDGSVLL